MSSIASNDSRTASIAAADGWKRLPPEYAIPERAPSQADAQEYCRAWPAVTTRIFPSRPGSCRSACASTFSMSTPTAGFQMIWVTKSAIPMRPRCNARPMAVGTRCLLRGHPRHPGVCRAAERQCANLIFPDSLLRPAESVSPGPDGHALTKPSKICSATATIRRIRWAIWFSTSADIAMLIARHFPISPVPRCNWPISGRT